MGSLDQPTGTGVQRKIALEDITGKTPAQIVSYFNDNLGNKGWRVIQILEVGGNRYVLGEKEV